LAAADVSDAELVAVRQAAGVDYLPSPTEIVETATEIRAGWTEAERARRWVGLGEIEWLPPEFVGVEDSGETAW
jgi:hypothetical protein